MVRCPPISRPVEPSKLCGESLQTIRKSICFVSLQQVHTALHPGISHGSNVYSMRQSDFHACRVPLHPSQHLAVTWLRDMLNLWSRFTWSLVSHTFHPPPILPSRPRLVQGQDHTLSVGVFTAPHTNRATD